MASLRKDIVDKQKIIIDIEKMRTNIVHPDMGTNHKVKTIVVVDKKPEGIQMKNRLPPSNMVNNKWMLNTRKALGPYIQMPQKKKAKWVKLCYHNVLLANHVRQRKEHIQL